MKKTFYSAYTCKNNLGDLIINKLQIEEYAKYGEIYIDFTGMPTEFKTAILTTTNPNIKDFNETFHKKYRGLLFINTIKFLKKQGFTHFTKSPGPYAILSMPLSKLIKRLLGALGFIYAQKIGLYSFALGIDLDYKTNQPKWIQFLNQIYFNRYNLIGVRSIINKNNYPDLENIKYCPDMAFLYSSSKRTCKNQKFKIGISFREVTEKKLLFEKLSHIAKLFLPTHQIEIIYQVNEDENFAKEIQYNLSFLTSNLHLKQITYNNISDYSQYDYIFSNRLHVLLLAAHHHVIPYALISKNIKERKIANIYQSTFNNNLFEYIEKNSNIQYDWLLTEKSKLLYHIDQVIIKQQEICKSIIKSIYNN